MPKANIIQSNYYINSSLLPLRGFRNRQPCQGLNLEGLGESGDTDFHLESAIFRRTGNKDHTTLALSTRQAAGRLIWYRAAGSRDDGGIEAARRNTQSSETTSAAPSITVSTWNV